MSVWSFFAGPTLSKQNIRNSLDVYVKVNESQHKQCGQTQHFSTGQKKKKILRKYKYWHNQLRKAFHTGKNLLKENTVKR